MKRALILMACLAVAAVTAAVVYQSEARERQYRLLLAQGDAAQADGQTFAAIEDYSGAIALRPDSMLAHLRRGETYRQRGDLDAAARDFRTAATLDPSATRPLEQWGDVLYELHRYRRAAEVYETRLQLDDRSALIRYRLGLAQFRAGDTAAAVESLRLASELDDHMSDAYYVLALCRREQGDPKAAADALKKAIARSAGAISVREELADLYRSTGNRAGELEQLQVLAALDGGRVERRLAVGLAHARTGHADLAVLTLASALEQWPDHPLIYGALGRVWLQIAENGDRPDALGKALEALARASSAATATSEVKALYGEALLRDGQLEAAERVLRQATEQFPVSPEAFATYASVATRLSRPEMARSALLAYHGLVGDDGDFPERALRLGVLSLELNDPAMARTWLRRASAVTTTGSPTLWSALAQAEARSGDLEAARAATVRGLELDPTSEPLLALARRIR